MPLAGPMESRLFPLFILYGFVHHQVEGLELHCSRIPIVTYVGSQVVLECQAVPLIDVEGKEIRWTKDKALVHLYRFGHDENDQQHPSFQGRTQLFKNQFHKGNVSLLLQSVILSDLGTYRCFVEILPEVNDDSDIDLQVLSIGLQPSISLHRYTSNGIELTCDSQLWFPEPVVEWKGSRGDDLSNKSTITTVKDSKGFYNVRSIIEVTGDSRNHYNCLMGSKEMNPLSATLEVADEFFPLVSKWVHGFWFILIVLIVTIGSLLLFFRRLQNHIKDLQKRPTVREYEELLIKEKSLKNKLGEQYNSLAAIRVLPQAAIKRITSTAASVTLDRDTAHPNLKISPNLKTVTYVAERVNTVKRSKRFDSMLAVMGVEGLSSGRHYWEVEVKSNSEWDLGVALDRVERQGNNHLDPDKGFWTIGFHAKRFQVNDVKDSFISMNPDVQAAIKMIGIYVNYSEGKVQFYNAKTYSHLHTFQKCHFGEVIFPFFKLTNLGTSLKIH